MEHVTQMGSDPRSFRDPSGHVFSRDGKIYRSIFGPGVKDFEAARDAGIYDKLIEAGLLLRHDEVNLGDPAPKTTGSPKQRGQVFILDKQHDKRL